MTFGSFCQKSCWLWHCSYPFSIAVLLFPLPRVFQFFLYLFPVFPVVVSPLFCIFWLAVWKETLAGLLLLSPLGMYYLNSWWLSTRMSNVGDASWCSSPCTCGGKNRAMLTYSLGPFFCSLRWDTGYKINSGFRSGFVGTCFLLLFWVCFAFEDPVRIVIELCVVGSHLVEYKRFMTANYLNVITRNSQVHGVTNCVCKQNKFLLTLSISEQNKLF